MILIYYPVWDLNYPIQHSYGDITNKIDIGYSRQILGTKFNIQQSNVHDMDEFDVCIVGGGPAGVIAAITIARSEYSVVIVDRKARDQIGNKNCGDAVDAKHVDILRNEMQIVEPSLEKGEARDLISKITIAATSLKSKLTTVTSPGYQVDRLVYGQRLLTTAEAEGTVIYDKCTVTDVLVEDDHIVGIVYSHRERGISKIRAKITIDASGFTAKIKKLIPQHMRLGLDLSLPNKYVVASYREIIRLEEEHDFREEIVWLYEGDIEPPGYIWIFSEGEKKLNIGICWVKNLPYPDGKSLKELYHQFLDPYFNPSGYTVEYSGGGNIPMRPSYDSLVFNGVMLTGDAACLADPTTFEGHGPALESGRLAGNSAIEALSKKSYSYSDLWSYNKVINDYLGLIHAQSFATARLFGEIGVNNLKFLLDKKIVTEDELINTFQDENAKMGIMLKIKKLFQAFPRWGVMFTLSKALSRIEKLAVIYKDYPEDPKKLGQWIDRRDKFLII